MAAVPAEIMSAGEVASRLGISEPTVRRVIRREHDENKPDELRTVPGGRCAGERYLAFRAIFDEVISGKALTQPAVIEPNVHPFVRKPLSRAS